jgi:hypothetical protein
LPLHLLLGLRGGVLLILHRIADYIAGAAAQNTTEACSVEFAENYRRAVPGHRDAFLLGVEKGGLISLENGIVQNRSSGIVKPVDITAHRY